MTGNQSPKIGPSDPTRDGAPFNDNQIPAKWGYHQNLPSAEGCDIFNNN
jgi:hypothetical protein